MTVTVCEGCRKVYLARPAQNVPYPVCNECVCELMDEEANNLLCPGESRPEHLDCVLKAFKARTHGHDDE